MTAREMLIDALQYYEISVLNTLGDRIYVSNNYEIEVEANGLYKLIQDNQVIAPFDDLDDLCLFVLRG